MGQRAPTGLSIAGQSTGQQAPTGLRIAGQSMGQRAPTGLSLGSLWRNGYLHDSCISQLLISLGSVRPGRLFRLNPAQNLRARETNN